MMTALAENPAIAKQTLSRAIALLSCEWIHEILWQGGSRRRGRGREIISYGSLKIGNGSFLREV